MEKVRSKFLTVANQPRRTSQFYRGEWKRKEYINNKNESELLMDVAMFWNISGEEQARKDEHSRRLETAT